MGVCTTMPLSWCLELALGIGYYDQVFLPNRKMAECVAFSLVPCACAKRRVLLDASSGSMAMCQSAAVDSLWSNGEISGSPMCVPCNTQYFNRALCTSGQQLDGLSASMFKPWKLQWA